MFAAQMLPDSFTALFGAVGFGAAVQTFFEVGVQQQPMGAHPGHHRRADGRCERMAAAATNSDLRQLISAGHGVKDITDALAVLSVGSGCRDRCRAGSVDAMFTDGPYLACRHSERLAGLWSLLVGRRVAAAYYVGMFRSLPLSQVGTRGGDPLDTILAVRAVRSAASHTVDAVAERLSVPAEQLVSALKTLGGRRGRCTEAADVAVVAAADYRQATVAAAHPACSPAARRAVGARRVSGPGAAGWAARRNEPHRSATPRIMRLLAGWPADDDTEMAAGNPTCPPALLVHLAAREGSDGPYMAACNPGAPPVLVERLAAHPEAAIVHFAARNPSCSPSTLTRLAASADPPIRSEAASNPAIPTPVLHQLAADEDIRVREHVALNPLCPPALLRRLCEDPEDVVREAAHAADAYHDAADEHVETMHLARLASHPWVEIRRRVAQNPAVHPDDLDVLANDDESWVRLSVAAHRRTRPDTVAALCNDSGDMTRCNAASNPNCPPEKISHLCGVNDPHLRFMAASNPACPTALLQRLVKSDDDSDVRSAAAMNLAGL